jgi:hypothetical protein
MPYRRYVVDQTLGVVDIFVEFLGLNRMQAHDFMPDSNAFRVEGREDRVFTYSSPGSGSAFSMM